MPGYGSGPYGSGPFGTGFVGGGDPPPPPPPPGPTVTIYIFEPPTHEEPMRTNVEPLLHYRLTWANSIVRINSNFQSIRTPAFEILEGLEQGVDWFRGGYVYEVSEETKDELELAGFDVREVVISGGGGEEPPPGGGGGGEEPPPGGEEDLGFGDGGFGSGLYGE